ncbi:uracil-DNA glycosylase [Aliiglaciecola litoralis]|uniref:Uracil-DNA glycosylase n=1 Tax=Aliiglaciecola litoralis TaxID=582857 RepID=A0ABN1LGF2_9ALTE
MATWNDVLSDEKRKPYFKKILDYVASEIAAGKTVYPKQDDVFNAFSLTEFDQVRVVILGQDPYHGPAQANGLCFSVNDGVKIPPSLRNIFKELAADIDEFKIPSRGNLGQWAQQGVLMLNTVLTVEEGKAHSHSKIGWERFTDKVISVLNAQSHGLVFLLWGSHAQKKGNIIDRSKHTVLSAPHPSPLSAHRGFFGCGHFSTTNRILAEKGTSPINWQL